MMLKLAERPFPLPCTNSSNRSFPLFAFLISFLPIPRLNAGKLHLPPRCFFCSSLEKTHLRRRTSRVAVAGRMISRGPTASAGLHFRLLEESAGAPLPPPPPRADAAVSSIPRETRPTYNRQRKRVGSLGLKFFGSERGLYDTTFFKKNFVCFFSIMDVLIIKKAFSKFLFQDRECKHSMNSKYLCTGFGTQNLRFLRYDWILSATSWKKFLFSNKKGFAITAVFFRLKNG